MNRSTFIAALVLASGGLAIMPVLALPASGAQPAPVVTAVCRVGLTTPQCLMGPVSGGYQVTISGQNLTGATQVSFGGMTAPSFTVDSATQITAEVAKSTLVPWRARRVSVLVTTPGGTSAGCAGVRAPCPAAFFYARGTSLAASGTKFSHQFSGSIGSVSYSGAVTIGSWSVSGSVQSSGRLLPEALLTTGKLTVAGLNVKLTVRGSVAKELKIRLPVPGLPKIAGVYLRLIPGLQGKAHVTSALTRDTLTWTIGWVNATGYHSGVANCHPAGCLGEPVLGKQLSGTLIAGPWLQIGPDLLNVGVGPAVGIYRDTTGVFDACAAIQAEANALTIHKTYTLSGPVNLSGTFAKCPIPSG